VGVEPRLRPHPVDEDAPSPRLRPHNPLLFSVYLHSVIRLDAACVKNATKIYLSNSRPAYCESLPLKTHVLSAGGTKYFVNLLRGCNAYLSNFCWERVSSQTHLSSLMKMLAVSVIIHDISPPLSMFPLTN